MDQVSFRLPSMLRRRLAQEARRRGMPQSRIIREALESALAGTRGAGTCADLARNLIGSVKGPRDLSTNRHYVEDAIVAAAAGGKRSHR
jgi:hypothetical protein